MLNFPGFEKSSLTIADSALVAMRLRDEQLITAAISQWEALLALVQPSDLATKLRLKGKLKVLKAALAELVMNQWESLKCWEAALEIFDALGRCEYLLPDERQQAMQLVQMARTRLLHSQEQIEAGSKVEQSRLEIAL